MALLLSPGVRIANAAGVPISGGKIRVYNANTTTLSSLYSDTGLTVPLANPVVCNSAGYPSSDGSNTVGIFCASANYDIAFMTAASVVLVTIDDVASYGSDAATLTKDFTNSRFAVRGSGGTIYVEAGDADPDAVGGTGILGGWLGTQADSWTINAAVANVVGRIKENSKKLPGVIYTDATTFSSSAGVAITLPNDPTGVRQWEVEIWDLQCAGVTALTCQLSYDGGGTYKSGAGDYWYTKWIADNTAGPGAVYAVSAGDTKLDLVYAVRTAANKSGRLTVRITTPNSGSEHTLVESDGLCLDRTAATSVAAFGMKGVGLGGFGRATHMKILQGANAISGSYRVKPLRGSGET
jgi:hypothetical protein